MLTRILPHKYRAKASAEGPGGNRALRNLALTSLNASKQLLRKGLKGLVATSEGSELGWPCVQRASPVPYIFSA